jgi:aqualysin 1
MNRLSAISLFAAGSLALAISACSDAPMTAADSSTSSDAYFGAGKLIAVPPGTEVIEDSYIVVFKKDAVAERQNGLSKAVAAYAQTFSDMKVEATFSNAFDGFSARIPEARLATLIADPRVEFIQPDIVVRACSTSTFQTLDWGVSYIGGDSSSTASGSGSGAVSGVEVYVLDSGIDPNHPDLNVAGGINYANVYVPQTNYSDDNGHGTHVAGIIGAKDDGAWTVGVAPGVALYAVKILTAQGYGSSTKICQGIDWVKARKAASPGTPMVANMSLCSVGNLAFDRAVKGMIDVGITVVVAAGNNSADAGTKSPARLREAITVGATSSTGALASFSNYGSVVDILAPGVTILSSQMGGGVRTLSGTSMASPMVAGAAALYLAQSGNSSKTPAEVATALTGSAAPWGSSLPTGTTNRIVRVTGY